MRDYCESCGYTDSHDPNCPRPKDSTAPAPAMPDEPQRFPPHHWNQTVVGSWAHEWMHYADSLRAALDEQRERADRLERLPANNDWNEAMAEVSNLRKRAESAERTAEQLRGDLAAARACIRDANVEWDKYLIDDYYKNEWRKKHAPAIEAASKEGK